MEIGRSSSKIVTEFVLNGQGQERKVHIVYMGDLPQEDVSIASTHHAMLQSAHGSASVAKKTLVFSYGRSFNGFAAKLTDEEATRVPGLGTSLLSKDKVGGPLEGDVIIGLLDTGIWPESKSFSDTSLGSLPSKWKGTCQGPNFNCSKKIIRARYYNSVNFYDVTDIKSPRDAEGHGTHTSSTAAGGKVEGASYLGLAEGTARGGAPGARIAITIDKKFVAKAVLGNGQVFQRLSINSFDLNGTTYPLIWGGDAVNYTVDSSTYFSSLCFEGAMNSEIVEGSIVFCETTGDGSVIMLANGVGTIMADSTSSDFASNYPLPATVISTEDGIKFLDYIITTEAPIATILVSETPDDVMAPIVVSFSSSGPSPISPDILKPNITAPGVDILAAWSPVAPPSMYDADTRSVNYNIISGTSMSCPSRLVSCCY
ncbi:hypothetical protein POM88_022644 [Heracleum sosnowskyi]|uniref:Subtilisin-like protease n=1 Tax=Heracleum sosnowskyi TaxID=360622 RepID=A0AAD8IFK1_9APIA|nr:hypothetical protein POM88_022644 [Heracleum sosnowskyi]